MTIDVPQTAAVLALLRHPPKRWSWPDVAREVLAAGDAVALLNEQDTQQSLLPDDQLTEATREVEAWQADDFDVVTVLDSRYPSRLRDILQVAPLLFTRGDLRATDDAVSVVGSRKASARGLHMAESIAGALVERGVTVVAGLAAGIDTAAHRSALDAGGRTVAVIGTGIRQYYPAANRSLQDEIARDGLVMSQFLPDSPPRQQHFPMRNAIMSGYGLATVVVEAGEHSGARIQARLAVEHGRPVILTDRVVAATEWGKALLGRPRVFVASRLEEALEALDHVRTSDEQVLQGVLGDTSLLAPQFS
jgi:DNA processing protein